MARPRSCKVPANTCGTYHVISRCARRAFLLGNDRSYRRDWLMNEMADLLDGFAIDIHAYAIMSNHFHLVLRSRPDRLSRYEPSRIVRLGMKHMPVRTGVADECLPVTDDVVDRYSRNKRWVAEYRERLSRISWFMRLLKQRISIRGNKEDKCSGCFWDSRFIGVPLLDWSAVLSCMVYVDLNPYRARMVDDPFQASYCSIRQHVGLTPWKVDRTVSKRLDPLGSCRPPDPYTGELPRSRMSPEEYRDLVCYTTGMKLSSQSRASVERLGDRLGFDLSVWSERMGLPGLFQSTAVGLAESRERFAEQAGKKWIADTTKIWR